jgi:type IV fimbrial biogenesis protein FimT
MQPNRSNFAGFTILEMMIAVAILGILTALAAPSFGTMLRNWNVRSMAESLQSGLQLARSEAIKRNANVIFAVVSTDPSTITGTTAPAYSATGNHWAVVREVWGGVLNYELLDSRKSGEGSGSTASPTAVTATTPGVAAGNEGRVVFNAFGRATEIDPASNAVFEIKGSTGGCGTGAGDVRCLNVVVTPAGSIKMCDPAVTAAGDSRKCPA